MALLLAGFTLTTGCENNRTKLTEEQAQQGLGLPDSSSKGAELKLDPRCKLNELVTEPQEGTPEFVIAKLFEAASADGDEDANFQKFFSHFPSDAQERWVRDQYFTRSRKHV
ncbi:MAG: hypothetical protein KC492_43570, partial [Myxococcales bacterium]|nr:hypothetical protein [Myxococcales bacterium]